MVDPFSFIQEYYTFEIKNNLFDVKDNRGNYIWDIFHYETYQSCLVTPSEVNQSRFQRRRKSAKLIILKSIVYTLLPIKRENFFFLSSRNRICEKKFDQNIFDYYGMFNHKECFLYETNSLNDLYYPQNVSSIYLRFILFKLFSCFIKIDKKTIIELYNIVKSNLPDFNLSLDFYFTLYRIFYFDIWFYKNLFRYHKIKRIFITQNGIQKGLFFVAKQMNIPVIEVQHGIVYDGHTAYSYPQYLELEKKVYTPTKISALSDFWFNDFYTPVKVFPVGNSFFSKNIERKSRQFILIISSYTIGADLASLTKELAQKTKDYFIFKLHNNEFCNLEFYENEFKKFENIKVFTNEKNLSDFLENTKVMITISSTCVYESIQAGIPVILYTRSHYYYMHKHIFHIPGIVLCNTPDEILDNISKIKVDFTPTVFFKPFNQELAEKLINEK